MPEALETFHWEQVKSKMQPGRQMQLGSFEWECIRVPERSITHCQRSYEDHYFAVVDKSWGDRYAYWSVWREQKPGQFGIAVDSGSAGSMEKAKKAVDETVALDRRFRMEVATAKRLGLGGQKIHGYRRSK